MSFVYDGEKQQPIVNGNDDSLMNSGFDEDQMSAENNSDYIINPIRIDF